MTQESGKEIENDDDRQAHGAGKPEQHRLPVTLLSR
jgi:hypothetical protein